MTKITLNNYSTPASNRGFTLIELIIVIIILGILAGTVAPKMFDSKGFTEFSYRSDIIAKLRLIQTKAMQQTNGVYCHRVLITATKLGAPDDCDYTPNFTGTWQSSATGIVINTNDAVTFSSNIPDNHFEFDSFGRPNCNPCTITINGAQSISVAIESEGYIHAL